MAKKKPHKDKKLHNVDEKLHNSHELDLSWQEAVDLLPEPKQKAAQTSTTSWMKMATSTRVNSWLKNSLTRKNAAVLWALCRPDQDAHKKNLPRSQTSRTTQLSTTW